MKKYNLYLIIFILTLYTALFSVRDRITINVSDSLPRGVYWLTKVEDCSSIKNGDIVVFPIPKHAEKYIYGRNYQEECVKTLIKKVAATGEDLVTRKGNHLYINGSFHSYFLEVDSKGRPLPVLSNEELQPRVAELFVVGTNLNSFDSKYFGVIKGTDVENTAKLIFSY